MRPEEVMRALAISRSSLYELVKEGLLDVVRPRPKLVRFKAAQVLALAEAGARPASFPNLRNQKEIAADAAE
jgi:excisionase family DNA binding protein